MVSLRWVALLLHLLDLLLALLHLLHNLLWSARRRARFNKAIPILRGLSQLRWRGRLNLRYRLLVIVGIFVI